MTYNDIIKIRLANQQITAKKFKSAGELTGWMGAVQAQDFAMARWGVGLRLKKSSEHLIINALDNAEIIRTHLLRPTWHIVSSGDIWWMLELTAPQISRTFTSRHKDLEITSSIIKKSSKLIESALSETEDITREEIISLWRKNKIRVNENRISHLLMCSELSGLICSGKIINNKQTYALLERRVKKPKSISREDALAKLVDKYFQSHSPAAVEDFTWWSGLSPKDARTGIEAINSHLSAVVINSKKFYMTNTSSRSKIDNNVYLLPAYDEFIISYKDRSFLFTSESLKKIISINGFFKPVVIINGVVSGTWKRTIKKDIVFIELELFRSPERKTKTLIEEAAERYSRFLNKEVEISRVNG